MDVNTLLENETVKSLLQKFGISEEQARSIANQAMAAIQAKFKANPGQMSSLLSDNPNTEDDEAFKAAVEEDFFEKLTKKVGLPDNIASQVKGAMPDIISQFTGKLNESGSNNESGISGMLGNLVDMFDGDDQPAKGSKATKKKSGGFMDMIGGFFGKK